MSDDALQFPTKRTVKSYSRRRQAQPIDGANIGKPFKEAVINNADLGAGSYAVLRDPYTFGMKIRFEEAYRTDPVIRAAINKKTAFVLGKKLNTIFDLVDSFLAPAEERAAMNILMTDQEYTNAKRVIDRVNRKVNFQQKLKAAFIQSKVYGRSALLVEAPPDGLPVNIKVLSSKLLGQVRIDERSWQLQQVQYNTNSRGLNDPYNFLQADDIIYFTNCDYHVSPYTIFYGLSDIEPVAHISETNRILNEEDFKEMNYSQWSGFGLLKIPTIRNAAEISSFLNNFKPGRWTAISQDITAEVHEMQKDLASMLTERNENEKLMLRQLAVPAAILGFEDVQNFATLQEVMCYSEDTELLTENGWKRFDRLLPTEKVATYNPSVDKIEYHVPYAFHSYDYDGDMIHFNSTRMDILVTPNHNMWHASTTKYNKWSMKRADQFLDVIGTGGVFRVSAAAHDGVDVAEMTFEPIEYLSQVSGKNKLAQVQSVRMDTWLEFLGYYLSEGNRTYASNGRYYVAFSQTLGRNKDKADKMEECVSRLPFRFGRTVRTAKAGTGWTNRIVWQADNKQLHNALNGTGDYCYGKKIPRWVFLLSERQLKILFDALMLGDGHVKYDTDKKKCFVYVTTSKQLADDVQELSTRLGYYSRIKTVSCNPLRNSRAQYHVRIFPLNKTVRVTGASTQPYKGKVHCISVKNHLFVTRRNGNPTIQGNSAWKESEIEEQRSWINSIVEPQWFDKLMCQILNIDDADEMKAKIMLAFEDIALENLKDKSLAVIPLYEAGILPADKVLEYLGFDDVADQVKMMQSKKDKINQQLAQQGYDPNAVAMQNRQPGQQPIPVQPAPSSSRGLLNITEDQQQAQGV